MLRNERGIAMAICLFTMAMLAGLTAAALSMSRSDVLTTRNYRSASQGLEAAEAGINHAVQIISNPGVGPVGLDIIDPRTWTYIASKQVTNTHFAYQLHSLTWNALGSPGTIFFRVVLPLD